MSRISADGSATGNGVPDLTAHPAPEQPAVPPAPGLPPSKPALSLPGRLRLGWRLVRIGLHVALGLAICALVFPWCGAAAHAWHVRRWSGRLIRLCGVRFEQPVDGDALAQALVVANHVSWLDIFVINAVHPCRFVAKAEIRAWPLLGWLAAKADTQFIARGKRRDLRHLFSGLVDKLKAGQRIAVFPEGTTAAQGQLLPFHSNLFEAAIDAQVPVQPYAVSYLDLDGGYHQSIEFIGAMGFAESLLGILAGPPIVVRLVCLPALSTDGAQRRALAQAAQEAVAAALDLHAPAPRED